MPVYFFVEDVLPESLTMSISTLSKSFCPCGTCRVLLHDNKDEAKVYSTNAPTDNRISLLCIDFTRQRYEKSVIYCNEKTGGERVFGQKV